MQFFGKEREHGWVGDKWLMAYKGLAAFEAEAEHNASLKVNPCRRAAWMIAVNGAERAIGVDRRKRICLLAELHRLSACTTVSSPKKQKRSYPRTSLKTSSSVAQDTSLVGEDEASPPRKKCRRHTSLPVPQDSGGLADGGALSLTGACDSGGLTDGEVLSLTGACDSGGLVDDEVLSSTGACDTKNSVSTEPCSAAEKNTSGKIVLFLPTR